MLSAGAGRKVLCVFRCSVQGGRACSLPCSTCVDMRGQRSPWLVIGRQQQQAWQRPFVDASSTLPSFCLLCTCNCSDAQSKHCYVLFPLLLVMLLLVCGLTLLMLCRAALQGCVPCRFRADKQLVSHDIHTSTYNYKYTFSVEIVPVCKVGGCAGSPFRTITAFTSLASQHSDVFGMRQPSSSPVGFQSLGAPHGGRRPPDVALMAPLARSLA